MGIRGPAPKPTRMKLMEGTYRPDRAPANEPAPESSIPKCPAWLHREAKKEWKRIAPHLAKLGLLSDLDLAALAAYCQCFADWYEAERGLKRRGRRTELMPWGIELPVPEVGMANAARKQMLQFLREFGMTPASRTRISVDPDTGKPAVDDPWAELARGPRSA